MKYELPKLNYEYGDLEPYIDAKTMEIHYTKHHQAYIDKLNAVLEKHPDLAEKPLEDLIKGLDSLQIPDADKLMIRNNGGGHLNHSFFWSIMAPEKEIQVTGLSSKNELIPEIQTTFGSVDDFKKKFSDAAAARFGSGWAWLVRDADGKLQVYSTANQDSPLMQNHTPLIGLDVWEHAYYLKYQNRRPEYIENWWKVLKLA